MLSMNTVSLAPIPLLPMTVSAGFPSPAAAYAAKPLVIDDWLWPQRASCQLAPWGMDGRTFLVLDRALPPVLGDQIWLAETDRLVQLPCE